MIVVADASPLQPPPALCATTVALHGDGVVTNLATVLRLAAWAGWIPLPGSHIAGSPGGGL